MKNSFKPGGRKLNTMTTEWYDEDFKEEREELAETEYVVSIFEHDEINEKNEDEQEREE